MEGLVLDAEVTSMFHLDKSRCRVLFCVESLLLGPNNWGENFQALPVQ